MQLISWNVNGIRSAYRKGFMDWLKHQNPDILAIQETKARMDVLPHDLLNIQGYHSIFSSAEKKGYSGVALYTKQKPQQVSTGLGISRFDQEGRTIIADYGDFVLFNIYFPNGQKNEERLQFKMDFYDAFLGVVDARVREGRNVIVCGDVNTAHREIDLARPKENENISGFLPIEREWMDKFISHGWVDTFRMFHPEPGNYTWWSMRTRARERNVGWRIDYFFVNEGFKDRVKDAFILSDVMGSDHCPIGLEI
ncbi:MAG: exodeoxyribonuclease III [Candidatus Marinimicrobia bacterium]|nr:exodeoxyribonuclease III [Candidatus Neomarinimicrobiota bacterium]RKY61522.1 MAG: exodeoxyribonuclease III [Candidatus Neomarinimicrobiota bacterium]